MERRESPRRGWTGNSQVNGLYCTDLIDLHFLPMDIDWLAYLSLFTFTFLRSWGTRLVVGVLECRLWVVM